MPAAKIVLPEPGLLELVAINGKGRGVVTIRPIKKGVMVEAGPVIKMKKADRLDRSTVLSHYPFQWDEPPYIQAFPLAATRIGSRARGSSHGRSRIKVTAATRAPAPPIQAMRAGQLGSRRAQGTT